MNLQVVIVWTLLHIAEASVVLEDDPCAALCIINRTEWGSSKSNTAVQNAWPVNLMFIHHSAQSECSSKTECASVVRGIQKFHIEDRGWDDIGYSFLIGGDGRVYVGRDWGKLGAHTYQYNNLSFGICFLGDFTNHTPSEKMIKTGKNLIACGVQLGYVKEDYGLYGHRDGRCTECPGNAFYNTLDKWDHWHTKGKLKIWC